MVNNMVLKIKSLITSGIFLIFISNIFIKLLSLISSIVLVRILQKETYGLFVTLENIYNIIFIFAGFGIANGLIKFLVINKNKYTQKKMVTKTLISGFLYNLMIVVFVIIAIFISRNFLSLDEFTNNLLKYLTILVFSIPASYVVITMLNTYRSLSDNLNYAIFNSLNTLVLITSNLLGAILYELNGIIYFRVVFISILSLSIVLFYMKKNNINSIDLINSRKMKISKEFKIYSRSLLVTSSIWSFIAYFDIFFMSSVLLAGPEMIADFKIANIVPTSLFLITNSIAVYITPKIVENFNNINNIRKLLLKTIVILLISISFIMYFLISYSEIIITSIFGEQYFSIINLFKLLLIASFIDLVFKYILIHTLNVLGLSKWSLILAVAGLLFHIIISISTFKYYGVISIAYSLIFSNILVSIFAVYLLFFKKNL